MAHNGTGLTAAATVGETRDVDQLGSSIASENNASATTTQAELITRIKTHIAKGNKAAEKAEQHYIAAGQHLKKLKAAHTGTWDEWETLLKTEIGIGKSRASELMAIADGTKTVEQVRAEGAERKAKERAKSLRDVTEKSGNNADDPEASAVAHAPVEPDTPLTNEGDDKFDRFVDKLIAIDRSLPRELYELLSDRYGYENLWSTLSSVLIEIEEQEQPNDGNGVDPKQSADKRREEFAALDDGLDIPECLRRAPKAEVDSDDDPEPNPPRRKKKLEEVCLGDATADAFGELQELAGECRDVVDNAPDGLSETQRIQTLGETADALEELEVPVVSAELAEIKVTPPKHRRPRSRADRRDNALNIIAACIEVLDSLDENDPRYQEAQSLRDELEKASSGAEMCEFPGMYR